MPVQFSRVEISRGSLTSFEATPDAVSGPGAIRGTVLMVPGYTGSKEDFLPLAPYVTAAGYRLVAYSQLGQYDSDGPDGPGLETEYTVEKFAADLLEVLEQVAPGEKVHLLGHSFGGVVTRHAVITAPDRFLDYVILDSLPGGENTDTGEVNVPQMVEVLRTEGNEGMWKTMFGQLEAMFPAPVRELLHKRILQTRTANLIGIGLTMADEPDRVAELAATGGPMLVVAGENDFIPVSVQRDMAERLGARFEMLAGAGHTPNEEMPEELTAVLVPFWDRA